MSDADKLANAKKQMNFLLDPEQSENESKKPTSKKRPVVRFKSSNDMLDTNGF